MMHDLSHSNLQLVSGGLSAATMSLAAVSAVAGYIGGRYVAPPSNKATVTGTSLMAIGCGVATHSLWANARFSPSTQLPIGTAANVLCGAAVGIGENVVEQIVTANPDYAENAWMYN